MKGLFEKKDLNIIAKHIKGFHGFPPMFHAHCEIVCVLSGSIQMTIDQTPRSLSAGEISISFPYSIHSYESSADAEAIIVLFSPAAVGIFEKKLLSHKPTAPYLKDNGEILPLLQKICHYTETGETAYEQAALAYLGAAIGEILILLKLTDMQETDLSTTQKILIYCSEHYKEEISVKSIANALFVSESTITKIFSSKLGYSFREYINLLRITDAKSMLKHTDKKIIDIMLECGFGNQSSFNRVFFEHCGLTPKEYRNQYYISRLS